MADPAQGQVVLQAEALQAALEQMALQLQAQRQAGHLHAAPWGLLGIRRGGVPLARRLALLLQGPQQPTVPVGTLDINLYRDDGLGPRAFPQVGESSIPFDLTRHCVALVDDVLFTGRTVRAALGAIADHGRPLCVRLAVLVDRGLREVPICSDACGLSLRSHHGEHVAVQLVEMGAATDGVVLIPGAGGHRAC